MLGPCWHYVGSFFALGRLFLALGRHLHVCWAFFTHVRPFFGVTGPGFVNFSVEISVRVISDEILNAL